MKNILIITSLLLITSCDLDSLDPGRSGTYSDDNIESPVLEKFKRYEPSLHASNKILDLLKDKKYEKIATDFVFEDVKPLLTTEKIEALIEKAELKYGKIVSYKPMQWAFEPKIDNGKGNKEAINEQISENYDKKKAGKKEPILFSVKIVQHENALVNYWFQFAADGKYQKLMGIFYKERKGTRAIGQL